MLVLEKSIFAGYDLNFTGADINRRDRYGCTALFYAVSEGYREVVKLLLSSGSDADIRTVKKLTCLTGKFTLFY